MTPTFKPKAAFTLAETLITLAIIGIIAALTVPNLLQKHEKQVTATKLKKIYLSLYQAVELSEIENGPKSEWNYQLPADKFMDTYLKPFIQINKKPTKEIENITNYKFLNGQSAAYDENAKAIIIPDGAIIMINGWASDTNSYRSLRVDINGTKKPNIIGKDVFNFCIHGKVSEKVYTSQLYNAELPDEPRRTRETLLKGNIYGTCTKNTSVQNAGQGCSSVIMLDGWQIKDDYPW